MSEWQEVALTDIYEISSGLSKPADSFGTGYPFLSFKDVFNNYFVPDELSQLVESSENERSKCSIKRGDVFLTRTSETMHELGMSSVALIDYPNATFNGFTKRLRQKEDAPFDVYPEFIAYYLRSPQFRQDMLAFSTMSTRASLNNGMIETLKIKLPPIETQKSIARVLKSLDDKIKFNSQINQTLEQIAQAIFKSWFVDFEPVKAKIQAKQTGQDPEHAAMLAVSGKTDEELDQLSKKQYKQLAETAALFPDELEDSELGEIPKGWEVSDIGSEFDVTMGQSPPGDTYNEIGEGIPFFQGRRDFGWRYPANRVYCTAPKRLAKKGDTLLSVRAPVGDVNKATSDCCIGRGIAAIRHKRGCEAYTYYSMQKLESHFNSYDTEGTVFGSINQKNLKSLKVIKPSDEIVDYFSEIAGKIDKEINCIEMQVSSLSGIRDLLLPKLLSGEMPLSCVDRRKAG